MNDKIKQTWRKMGLSGRITVVLALGLLGVIPVLALDTDNDGMSDTYELFFGLDHNNAADATLNYDTDSLSNLDEYTVLTDPFMTDTDRDGWPDGSDDVPVSRAYLDWGNEFFTTADVLEYIAPAWMTLSGKMGGEWVTNAPSSWHVLASETNAAQLLIELDRSIITNDVALIVSLYDHTNALIYIDLYDTNSVMVATNIAGNLTTGNDVETTRTLTIPLETYSSAVTIGIRRESGEATIYNSLLYVDRDGDGLDAEQEEQLGTSDNDTDSDDDGISDYDEVFIYGTDPTLFDSDGDNLSDYAELNIHGTNPINSDSDGDGLSDGVEVNTHGTNPNDADSDGDGMSDSWEVSHGFNPSTGTANLMGYWKLDETSGSSAVDSSGNDNDGTVYGATHVTGFINNALKFDGDSNYVAIANSSDYKPTALTVSCFVNVTELYGNTVSGSSEDGRMTLVAQANNGTGYAYALYKSSRHALVFELSNAAQTNTVVLQTVAPFVSTGEWIHVTGTYDGTNASLYVDGQLICQQLYSAPLEYDAASGLVLGNNPASMDDSYLCGQLDGVRVLNVALAADQIAAPYTDSDGDGLTNLEEAQQGTDPNDADSDNDGLSDYEEIVLFGTNPNDSDTDNDGMADSWEIAHDLDATENDAAGDADSDGLTNLAEYQNGTDPNLSDTDADGISDSWEINNGSNPTVADADADPDGDGLTNLEEYLNGTDPLDADSDDDGVNDFIEVTQAHSDPNVVDFSGVITTHSTVYGNEASSWVGSWSTEGSVIYARERSGYVEYTITIPDNGIYALEVDVTQHNALTSQSEFDLSLYVDGEFSGRQTVIAPYGVNNSGTFFMPSLSAGTHTARIRWRNLSPNTFLQINALHVQTYEGTDNNTNAIPDWLEKRWSDTSVFDTDSLESVVSPVCLEGESLHQDLLEITTSYVPEGMSNQTVVVKHGVSEGWYSDIQLSPTSATTVVVSEQDGAEVYSNQITWVELNVLDESVTNTFYIRNHSSLLLTAYPTNATNGTVSVDVYDSEMDLMTNKVTSITQPFECLFDAPGAYYVIGSYSNAYMTTNRTVNLKVDNSRFADDEVVTLIGDQRDWLCPDLSHDVVVEYDDALNVSYTELGGSGVNFAIVNQYDTAFYMVARLREGGPILDNALVSSVYGDNGSYWRVVETYADGSRMIEVRLSLGYVPDDLVVCMSIAVGGVVFDDGTITRTLTADDFDELGVATYRLIQPADVTTSVCHYTSIYDGDVRIR